MATQQLESLDTSEVEQLLNAHLERRATPRYPYRVVQKMAPIRRGIQAPFRDVNCSDISAGGISFYLDFVPDFDEFAMTLKNSEHQINVLGRVVGNTPMKGTGLQLIHCEFLRRVPSSM